MRFRLEAVFVDDIAILYSFGRVFSCREAAVLSGAAMPLLAQQLNLILNLGGVKRVDTGGLSTLLILHMYARSSGRFVRLCHLNRFVQKLIDSTRLDTLFEIYNTEKQARGIHRHPGILRFMNNSPA